MLFTSYEFLGFLLVVFLIYYLLRGKAQWSFLLISSYVFYFIADPRYLIFIAITTVSTFFAARAISDKKTSFDAWFKEHKKEMEKEAKARAKGKQTKSDSEYAKILEEERAKVLAEMAEEEKNKK